MSWKYKPFLREMDGAITRLDDAELSELWNVTKADVLAFSAAIAMEGQVPIERIYPAAWSRWEDLFTDPEDYDPIETTLLMSISEFKEGCPDDLWAVVHFALEVGFARGRGFTRKEAIEQQEEFIESQGGFEAFYHPRNDGSVFTVIEGGKA